MVVVREQNGNIFMAPIIDPNQFMKIIDFKWLCYPTPPKMFLKKKIQ